MVPFSMTLNDPDQDFKGMPLFDVDISVTAQDRHCYNVILIWTHTNSTQWYNFKWPRVTLSDLEQNFQLRRASLRHHNCLSLNCINQHTTVTGTLSPSHCKLSIPLQLFVVGWRLTFLTFTYNDFTLTVLVFSIIVDTCTAGPVRAVVGLALNI